MIFDSIFNYKMSYLQLYRTIHLIFHIFILYSTIIMSLVYPSYVSRITDNYAKEQGYSKIIIMLTKVLQHYTVWSHICIILALICNKRELEMVAHILQTNLFLLYYIIRWFDIGYLTYVDNYPSLEYLHKATSWKFPLQDFKNKNYGLLGLWIVQNTKHLLAPLHFWVEHLIFNSIEHDNSLLLEINMLFICYGLWNFYCWHVRGLPVYPIQKVVKDKGLLSSVLFYTSCIVLLNISALVCDYLL